MGLSLAWEPFCAGVNCRGHPQSHRCCVDWQLAFCWSQGMWKAPYSVCYSVPFCRDTHFKYGGADWNFWQLSVTMVNYLSVGLSYPFVSCLSNYILYLQVIPGMLTLEHTGSFSMQYKNKAFCGNRNAWYW